MGHCFRVFIGSLVAWNISVDGDPKHDGDTHPAVDLFVDVLSFLCAVRNFIQYDLALGMDCYALVMMVCRCG